MFGENGYQNDPIDTEYVYENDEDRFVPDDCEPDVSELQENEDFEQCDEYFGVFGEDSYLDSMYE
jgi:hypothetical protein